MQAMVLAAGVGSRLDPLTAQLPKPMVPVANRPVMEHILKLLKKHGLTDILCNLHYLPASLVEHFGSGEGLGVRIRYHHKHELSGDGGGGRTLRPYLAAETFLVVMGDLLTDADLSNIVQEHKAKGALATIAIKPVEDVSQFGVVKTNAEGFIKGFQEKPAPDEAVSNLASCGIYVLEPEIFDYIPASGPFGFGRQLFPQLVLEGRAVLGVVIDSYWSDVGTIRQYRLSNFDALAGRLKLDLPGRRTGIGWLGAGASVASDCRVDGLVLLGRNSHLLEGVRIEGSVVIGDNCVVNAGAQVCDSVIWDGAIIGPSARVKDSVIGSQCLIEQGSVHTEDIAVDMLQTGSLDIAPA